jgi:hypothetical protein
MKILHDKYIEENEHLALTNCLCLRHYSFLSTLPNICHFHIFCKDMFLYPFLLEQQSKKDAGDKTRNNWFGSAHFLLYTCHEEFSSYHITISLVFLFHYGWQLTTLRRKISSTMSEECTPRKRTRNIMLKSKKTISRTLLFHHTMLAQMRRDKKEGQRYFSSIYLSWRIFIVSHNNLSCFFIPLRVTVDYFPDVNLETSSLCRNLKADIWQSA